MTNEWLKSHADLHGVVAPGLEVAAAEVHPHEPVEGDAEQLLPLGLEELHHEVGDAELRQRLPRLDVVHLGLDQVAVGDVGVRLQNPLV